jgi:DNA-binding NtrC family response regulator
MIAAPQDETGSSVSRRPLLPRARILMVDDLPEVLAICLPSLRKLPGAEILVENHSDRAANRLEVESPDLLITDLKMPGLSGLDLLRLGRKRDPNLAVLILTAYPTVETAVECMKLGAAEYMTKPFLPQDLLATVQRLLEAKQLREENVLLRHQVQRDYAFGEMLGTSQGMAKAFSAIQRAAETHFDVLVEGETGTGKELAARAIHKASRRRDGPFVPVDCGAIPDELMESEFFGHERGAFTGAQSRRLGLLELADKGTFFLDEVAQLPLRLQAKLLRVLQERRIRRVGGTTEISLNVRIITASSVDLKELAQTQRFRLDLFHRIHAVVVSLPPLRERAADIPLLVSHFIGRYAREMERPSVAVSPGAMEVLCSYSWPGNVRELQNVLQQALVMAPHPVISAADLPEDLVVRAGSGVRTDTKNFFELREQRVAAFEKEYFQNLLGACQGDVSAAAREAGVPRCTLYRLLKKYELVPNDFRGED